MNNPELTPAETHRELALDTDPELDPPVLLEPEEAKFYQRVYRYASSIIYDTTLRLGGEDIARSASALGLSWDGNPSKAVLRLLDDLQKGTADTVLQQINEFKTAAGQSKSRIEKIGSAAIDSIRKLLH